MYWYNINTRETSWKRPPDDQIHPTEITGKSTDSNLTHKGASNSTQNTTSKKDFNQSVSDSTLTPNPVQPIQPVVLKKVDSNSSQPLASTFSTSTSTQSNPLKRTNAEPLSNNNLLNSHANPMKASTINPTTNLTAQSLISSPSFPKVVSTSTVHQPVVQSVEIISFNDTTSPPLRSTTNLAASTQATTTSSQPTAPAHSNSTLPNTKLPPNKPIPPPPNKPIPPPPPQQRASVKVIDQTNSSSTASNINSNHQQQLSEAEKEKLALLEYLNSSEFYKLGLTLPNRK